MTDQTDITVLIVTSVFGLLGVVASGIIAYYRDREAHRQALEVARKVDAVTAAAVSSQVTVTQVAQDLAVTKAEKAVKNAVLDSKLDAIGATAVAVHTLVNGRMVLQLTHNAALARRLAAITKDPADIAAADAADKALADHLAKEKETTS